MSAIAMIITCAALQTSRSGCETCVACGDDFYTDSTRRTLCARCLVLKDAQATAAHATATDPTPGFLKRREP